MDSVQFKLFRKDRKQYVSINGFSSYKIDTDNEVPQESSDDEYHIETSYHHVNTEVDEIDAASIDITANGVDEALEKTGRFGRFQILLQFTSMLFVLVIGNQTLSTYFTGINSPWRYVNVSRYGNRSYDVNDENFNRRCNLTRYEWTYTQPKRNSFVTEYDLVCKKEYLAALTDGAFFIGASFGTLLCGYISDTYGRKRVFLVGLILNLFFSILSSFIQKIWQLILIRMLIGASGVSSYGLAFIILSELMPPSFRAVSSNMFHLTASVSQMLLALEAYYEREWRKLTAFLTLPCIISLIMYAFVPKSPRWLVAVGKVDDAKKVLKMIGKFNCKPLNNLILTKSSIERKYSYYHLFAHRQMVILTSVQCLIWMTIGVMYYTITLESSNLGGNTYVSFALSALSDLPSNFAAAYTCGRFGRKKTVLVNIVLSSMFTVSIIAIPNHYNFAYTIRITFAMLGKFFVHCAFNGIYLWTFELFPTVIRTQGWIFCDIFARISGFVAPFLTTMLQSVNPILPYILISVCGVLTSIVGQVLPETNNLKTRETFDDIL